MVQVQFNRFYSTRIHCLKLLPVSSLKCFDTVKQFLKMKIQLKTVRYPGKTCKENVKIFFPLEEVIYIFLRI